jgi:membrane-associated phospholipid phosphatase
VSSVFPSGHVAAVTATALTVRQRLPRLGVVFIVAALSIATVYGRYHYAADALAGAVIGTFGVSLSSYLQRQ